MLTQWQRQLCHCCMSGISDLAWIGIFGLLVCCMPTSILRYVKLMWSLISELPVLSSNLFLNAVA